MEKFDSVDVDLALSELLRDKLGALTIGSIEFNNTLNLQWQNIQAVQKVYQISATIGRLPDLYDSQVGGQAIWLYPKSKTGKFYDEFLVKDVSHFHTRPELHLVYFTVTITMPLKVSTRDKLVHVIETSTYNRISQQLSVSCHFLGAIILGFYVIARLDSGEISLEEARSIYASMIPLLSAENEKIESNTDMKSVPTPITDTLEKYVFDKTNTKLSSLLSERRSVKTVTQAQIMMTTSVDRPVDATLSTGARIEGFTTSSLPVNISSGPRPIDAAISAPRPPVVSISAPRPVNAALSSSAQGMTLSEQPSNLRMVRPASAAYQPSNQRTVRFDDQVTISRPMVTTMPIPPGL